MEKVLVLAPHPDDELIGCGGSLTRHVRQGDQVGVVYLTSGESGSLQSSSQELALRREAEAREAATLLGITDLTFLRFPDGYLEFNQRTLDAMVTVIRAKQPDRIYLPHSLEAVPDHQLTHRLVMEGIRRAEGPWHQHCGSSPWQVNTVLGYEVWTPLTAVGHSQDISEYIDIKLRALRLHHSQITSIPYDQAVEGLNRYRGIMTGQGQYCECFQLLRAKV